MATIYAGTTLEGAPSTRVQQALRADAVVMLSVMLAAKATTEDAVAMMAAAREDNTQGAAMGAATGAGPTDFD
jgi:hypothetical protein